MKKIIFGILFGIFFTVACYRIAGFANNFRTLFNYFESNSISSDKQQCQ